jgi:hypothetical protein
MAVSWDAALCSLVYINLRFRGYYKAIALTMEAVITPETSVNIYQTTRLDIPETAIFILIAVRT